MYVSQLKLKLYLLSLCYVLTPAKQLLKKKANEQIMQNKLNLTLDEKKRTSSTYLL